MVNRNPLTVYTAVLYQQVSKRKQEGKYSHRMVGKLTLLPIRVIRIEKCEFQVSKMPSG